MLFPAPILVARLLVLATRWCARFTSLGLGSIHVWRSRPGSRGLPATTGSRSSTSRSSRYSDVDINLAHLSSLALPTPSRRRKKGNIVKTNNRHLPCADGPYATRQAPPERPVAPHARTITTYAVDSPFLRPYRRGGGLSPTPVEKLCFPLQLNLPSL